MGFCGCGHKTWTKIFISFTIIFCLAQFAALAFTVYIPHEENFRKKDNPIIPLYAYLFANNKALGLSITSLVFNLLWIIACINVLVNLSKSEVKQSLVTAYILWNISAIGSFIIDAVSIILYGIDYSKNEDEYGPLYMLLIASRVAIGVLFNLCAIIGMIIITNISRKKLEKKPKKRTVPLKPPKSVLKTPTKEPYLEENNIDRVRDWHKHYEESNNFKPNEPNPDIIPNYIPRLSEVPKDIELQRSSSLYSNDAAHNPLPGSNTNVLVNGVPSGTLRRQLPWSYMPNPNELPHLQPRKQPIPVPTPYVPAPDYYQKKAPKPNSRRDFHKPGWSQHL